jgi:hypothetical protein
VPAGGPFGHGLGTGRIAAGHRLADRPMVLHKPRSGRRVSLTLQPVYRTGCGGMANEDARAGDQGPAGSWAAAGHPAA